MPSQRQAAIENGERVLHNIVRRKPYLQDEVAVHQLRVAFADCAGAPRSECPYGVLQLRDLYDKVAPGLGNTRAAWLACEALTSIEDAPDAHP
jgi:hypothetical protein